MSAPVRYSFGVSTNERTQNLGFFGMPDPTKWNVFFNDFHFFTAADWTITKVGTGTNPLAAGDGGWLTLVNSAADNDSIFVQKTTECFALTALKRTIGKVRFKVDDVTQCDLIFGLIVTDTTPLAAGGDGVTDGVFFQKDDETTNVDFYVQKNTTTGQIPKAAWTTMPAADTFVTLGFDFDGKRTVKLFKNDSVIASLDLGNTPSDYLPDTTLTPTFGIQNGSAAARTLTLDYLFFAQER